MLVSILNTYILIYRHIYVHTNTYIYVYRVDETIYLSHGYNIPLSPLMSENVDEIHLV